MNEITNELKTKLEKWRRYHRDAKTRGDKADAREYWQYIQKLKAAIKKLETP
jgi:phage shock protein A